MWGTKEIGGVGEAGAEGERRRGGRGGMGPLRCLRAEAVGTGWGRWAISECPALRALMEEIKD